jgi:hypothetical protein
LIAQILQLIGMMALLFVASMCMGYLVTRRKVQTQKVVHAPEIHADAKLKSKDKIFRSHFIHESDGSWVFAAPLQKDTYVPFRIGEELVIESMNSKGAFLFRSYVIERKMFPHVYVIAKPSRVFQITKKESME